MQRLRSFWKRPGPAKLEPDVADPVANLPTAVHKQLCTADPFRCIDLRISEEIDARLRSDLAQELYDPIEDPTHSPLSSIFAYPQAPPNRANGHANLPARLLDTQDMVRYLAEQRHASSGKERLPNNASSRKSSHCDSIKDEEVAVQAERQTRHALIKTSITIAFTSGILCCIILVVLKLSLQKLAQSAVDQAFIDWKGLRIEQLTPDSCHISAEGLFNNINFDGVLKSAEYEILDPNIPTRSVGHITLPDIGFGNAQGTLFRLDESVVFLNAAASTNFFDGFGNATARFSLRGATTLTWRKFGSRVHLDPLYTYSSGMVDHVRFSSMNAFNLSTSPGQDQIVFQSGIMVENTSPVSVCTLDRSTESILLICAVIFGQGRTSIVSPKSYCHDAYGEQRYLARRPEPMAGRCKLSSAVCQLYGSKYSFPLSLAQSSQAGSPLGGFLFHCGWAVSTIPFVIGQEFRDGHVLSESSRHREQRLHCHRCRPSVSFCERIDLRFQYSCKSARTIRHSPESRRADHQQPAPALPVRPAARIFTTSH